MGILDKVEVVVVMVFHMELEDSTGSMMRSERRWSCIHGATGLIAVEAGVVFRMGLKY